MNRSGQASGAAVLLAIIAGMIILFIVLIPPSEREQLLGTGTTPGDDTGETPVKSKSLLQESPGRLDFLDKKELDHPLPVINIYTKEESKVIARKNLARVSQKIFSEMISDFPFVIEDLENTENVLLSFNVVEKSTGNLMVRLNGDEIYNAPASPGAIQPLRIPKNALQNSNIITFAASSPGIAFWKVNEITVKDAQVTADVSNLQAQKSYNIFLVTETEKSNLEKIVLQFQPTCIIDQVEPLTITINGREVYRAVPDCDVRMIPIEFSPQIINQGENEIVFITEKGTYQLSHVVIRSLLEEVDFPTYYFDLSFEEYQAVNNDELEVVLQMDFVDVTARKIGEVVFNGRTRHFDSQEVSEEIDLSVDIVQGTNALKIKPRKTLEIRQLKVDLKN